MKQPYTKPKMRAGDFLTAVDDFAEARQELFDALYQEFAPPLLRICDKITKALEWLNGNLEAK
jgi:hypothetical protein